MISKYEKTYKSFLFILGLVLNASLGAFFVGYQLGELNLLLVDLKHIYSWSTSETSIYTGLLNALLPIGAIVGALLSGNYLPQFGRRNSLIFCDVLGAIGCFFCIFEGAGAFPQIIGRFLAGISTGVNCQLVPSYINEMTPREISGFMGSFFQSTLNVGIMLSYCLGLNIPDDSTDYDVDDTFWKFVFAMPIITCFIRFVLLMTVYRFDTPFSLMKRHRDEELTVVLEQIYQEEYIDDIREDLENRITGYHDVSYRDLATKYRSRFVLGIVIMAAQQLSGINAVVTESSTLYSSVGDTEEVKILTVMNSVILLIAAFVAGLTTDKFGRRTILLLGNGACSICLLLMAIFQGFSSTEMQELSVFMTFVCLFSFGISLGPVAWVYGPEILPDKGISFIILVNWFFCGWVVFLTPILIEDVGVAPIYYFFCILLVVFQVYFYFFLKETKGKSAIEVDEMFGTVANNENEYGRESEEGNNGYDKYN